MGAINWNALNNAPAPAQTGAINWGAIHNNQNSVPANAPDPIAQTLAGMSPAERFIASAGGAAEGMLFGVKQRLGYATPQDVAEWHKYHDPLANTRAGWWGNLAGTAGSAAPAMLVPGANTYAGSALVGALLGGAQPTQGNESVATNAALGAAGGMAGKYVGGKVADGAKYVYNAGKRVYQDLFGAANSGAQATARAGGVSGATTIQSTPGNVQMQSGGFGPGVAPSGSAAGLNPAQESAMQSGRQLGFRLTPGQATGSVPLQQVEAYMESHPATSGPFNRIKASNQTQLNRIAANAIGEDSPVLDNVTLGNAAHRIGEIYDQVRGVGGNMPIDPDSFLGKLAQTESEYAGLLGPEGNTSIADIPLVKRFFNYAGKGGATTEQLSDLASKLGKASTQNMTSASGDRQLGMALGDVKNHVDDVLMDGLNASGNADLAGAFSTARGQYRNLMQLTGRANIVNPSNGNVNARALAALLQQKDRSGFLFGNNNSPLYEAARFGQAFPPLVGDSGTATRMGTDSLSNMLMKIPGHVVSSVYTSEPAIATAQAASSAANTIGNGINLASGAASPVLYPLLKGASALGPAYPSVLAALLASPKLSQQDPTQP